MKNKFYASALIAVSLLSFATLGLAQDSVPMVIDSVSFKGNSEIPASQLAPQVNVAVNSVFNESLIKSDIRSMEEYYHSMGFLEVSITYDVSAVAGNRETLTYNISEGKPARIDEVKFVGNQKIKTRDLLSVIDTKKSRPWLFFLNGNSKLDPKRIATDAEKLRSYYFKQGLLDIKIKSQILSFNGHGYSLSFTVDEGEVYRESPAKIVSDVAGIDLKGIRLENELNHFYSMYDDLTQNPVIEDIVRRADKAKVVAYDIEVEFARDEDKKLAGIVFKVIPASPLIVAQINIIGNVKTHDEVIRREFEHAGIKEGIQMSPAFYRLAVAKAYKRLAALGYLATVNIKLTN